MAGSPRQRATGSTVLNPLPEEAPPATTAQAERRKRIVEATIALAAKGGYDAVQMRTVAEKADVALGTLYRYFPSKIHLLVTGLAEQFEAAQERQNRRKIPGATTYERVLFVLNQATRTLQRNPQLTEAMTRAFMFADTSAAAEVDRVAALSEQFFTRAMTDDEPTNEQRAIARVITDVWMSNLVAWVTRRASATDVSNRLELTVRLLIGDPNETAPE
ncbi:cholesterol catabolism transcriptional regulator KstR [Allosaccharopolyspora coralli]|uniref:Cholesterol catabolism transcriptional regulator KstR n=1 Tax=Allosaccharopolyspora coralli TaxID=2665642 RepID=A0A5Q3QG00_9PSEU|nr:cholesterol catabolism transcriptional regulator KstR [Allosaccharopolyspora coralli]QGK70389.1 cholesterol catabolism transcriptional regulator KstR [Allosaccharopolyspora coralli]